MRQEARIMRRDKKNNMNGFTLIEVLVAMVVMAIGLLGLASLQALALKDNQDAYFRSQANFLLYEMGDRIHANAEYWKRSYVDPQAIIAMAQAYGVGSQPNCNAADPGSAACVTSDDLALYDVYRWWQDVKTALPLNPIISIAWEDDPTTLTIGGNEVIKVRITWDKSRQPTTEQQANGASTTTTLTVDVRL